MNKIRNNAGIFVVILLVLFVGTFLATSLFKSDEDNYVPAPEEAIMPANTETVNSEGPAFTQEGKLWFISAKGDTITGIRMEVAETEGEITQGLMYRKTMAKDEGMLFTFPDEQPRSFWMKNTILPLDIIYADANGVIGSSQNYTTPFSEASLPSEKPSKYVVEVNAGFWDQHKLKAGDKVVFSRN